MARHANMTIGAKVSRAYKALEMESVKFNTGDYFNVLDGNDEGSVETFKFTGRMCNITVNKYNSKYGNSVSMDITWKQHIDPIADLHLIMWAEAFRNFANTIKIEYI